jgi:hypothetical protein
VGDLDLLLPVVSGCFLICFCAVNLTCFVLEFSPRAQQRNRHFRLYSKWSALLGEMERRTTMEGIHEVFDLYYFFLSFKPVSLSLTRISVI